MKIYYTTDDGKTFSTAEAAKEHEDELKSKTSKDEAAKKEIMTKIKKNNEKLFDLKKQIERILDENDNLSEQYKKCFDPEQQEFFDTVEKLLNKIFG